MQKLNNKDFLKYLKDTFNIVLNKGQEESVLNIQGPMQVCAVPGAGKTFSVCTKLFNMVWNYNINPARILSVTFSKTSAKDMDAKFKKTFEKVLINDIEGYENNPIKFSTIHSFAYKIVRDYAYLNNIVYEIIEDKKKAIISQIYKSLTGDIITDDLYETISGYISLCKNKLLPLEEIKYLKDTPPNFYDIYITYEDYKVNNNYIDYDDMLNKALEILKTNDKLNNKYANMYDYVIVDEAQDTSTVQYEIINIIATTSQNICIIGDDDQNLYEWRSADVDNFLHFDKYFKETKKVFMEQNYRSTKNIINLSNQFIKKNVNRYDKNLFTDNEIGDKINIVECYSYNDEIEFLIDTIKSLENLSNTAILYRNNISTFAIANMLSKNNIPFYLKDYKENFFKHWILQDFIAFFNVAKDQSDYDSFKKIAFKMTRYISKKMLFAASKNNDKKIDVFDGMLKCPDLKYYQKENILTLRQEFKDLSNKNVIYAINYICDDFGYLSYLKKLSDQVGYSFDNLKEIIFIIKEISSSCESIFKFKDSIDEFKEKLDNARNNFNNNSIVLSTCHSAKGLEWENVFMFDLNDGVFPSYKSLSDAKDGDFNLLESERRLYYVGITRAKKHLTLIHTINKNGVKMSPSTFTKEIYNIGMKENILNLFKYSKLNNSNKKVNLFERTFNKENYLSSMEEDLMLNPEIKSPRKDNKKEKNVNSFAIGDKISHINLGVGYIENIKNNYITVKFENNSRKNLDLDVCIKKSLIKKI